jgi:hypothetical protein
MAARSAGKKTTSKKTATDDKKYLCPYCMKEKKKTEFYMSTDPLVLTGITTMCKECARKIAMNWDERTQQFGTCTKASIQEALIRLDKPFLNKIWDSSYLEWANNDSERRRTTIWDSYIKNLGMVQYRGMRWQDSDIFDVLIFLAYSGDLQTRAERVENHKVAIFDNIESRQHAFIKFVLDQYVRNGVGELDNERVGDLIKLKYGSAVDAQEQIGSITEIRNTFLEFQKYLYKKVL